MNARKTVTSPVCFILVITCGSDSAMTRAGGRCLEGGGMVPLLLGELEAEEESVIFICVIVMHVTVRGKGLDAAPWSSGSGARALAPAGVWC